MLLLLAGILSALYLVYYLLTKNHNYFAKRGLPYEKPVVLFGNHWRVLFQKNLNLFEYYDRYYKLAKPAGIGGIFETLRPIHIVADVEILKNITIKDFDHFVNHFDFAGPDDIFSKSLIGLKDNKWKDVRGTLSPAFTGNKLKIMYELIEKCASNLEMYLRNQHKKQNGGVVKMEIKNLVGRFTNDGIATTAFGIDINSINDKENEFYLMGKDLVDFTSGFRWLKTPISLLSPTLLTLIWKEGFFDAKPLSFFRKIFMDNINTRRNSKIFRPDMMHLMLEAVKNAQETHKKGLSDEEMLAQAIIFFFGGFETISATMCFLCHHLAQYPDIQDKLFNEIQETLKENDNVMNYDTLKNMRYLDMVLNESQRIQPVFPFTDRICSKEYTIPAKGSRPEVIIQPGEMMLIIPYSFHHDPEYFHEPEKFIPERFSEENKSNFNQYAFVPFGLGPRQCIANRFAKMEIKIVILTLLKSFEIVFIEETQHPIKLLPTAGGTVSEKGFWLGFKLR